MADKRHPLLREQTTEQSDSVDIRPSSVKHKSREQSLNDMENRALLDGLRGPPLVVTMKDRDGFLTPDIVRGSLKVFLKMEYFRLPEDVPVHIWFKLHLKDFVEHVRVINKALIYPNCKRKTCKTMAGPPGVDYLWNCNKEGFYTESVNKKMSAIAYIEKVVDTSSMLLKNNFKKTMTELEQCAFEASKTIVRLVFRVYSHILYHHHNLFVETHTLPHLNNCFTWFILFSTEFQLLDEEECRPLRVLINHINIMASAGDQDTGYEEEGGLQMSLSHDRLSSFLTRVSDDISKLTETSFCTGNTFYS